MAETPLAQAQRRVEEGRAGIARQEMLIAALACGDGRGYMLLQARGILARMRATQAQAEEHLEHLRAKGEL